MLRRKSDGKTLCIFNSISVLYHLSMAKSWRIWIGNFSLLLLCLFAIDIVMRRSGQKRGSTLAPKQLRGVEILWLSYEFSASYFIHLTWRQRNGEEKRIYWKIYRRAIAFCSQILSKCLKEYSILGMKI